MQSSTPRSFYFCRLGDPNLNLCLPRLHPGRGGGWTTQGTVFKGVETSSSVFLHHLHPITLWFCGFWSFFWENASSLVPELTQCHGVGQFGFQLQLLMRHCLFQDLWCLLPSLEPKFGFQLEYRWSWNHLRSYNNPRFVSLIIHLNNSIVF